MTDPHTVFFWLASAYAAVGVGVLSALLTRAWTRRRGGVATAAESAWCALLPAVSLLLLPLSARHPHLFQLPDLHAAWHGWERTLHAEPAAHGALHAANSVLLLLGAFFFARTVYTVAKLRTFATAVRAASELQPEPFEGANLYTIPSRRPLCFTMGVFRPAIYVTAGLRQQLSQRDCAAMLAHESAHIRRRDNLVKLLLTLFYALFPLPGCGLLLRDWRQAAERECDAAAAHHVGSAADVAAALVRTARVMARSSTETPGGACFAAFEDDLDGRVQALLTCSPLSRRPLSMPPMVLGLGLLIIASSWLHHAVEMFVRH